MWIFCRVALYLSIFHCLNSPTSPLQRLIVCLCFLHSSLQSFILSLLSWTGCPSSLCHFSLFLPLLHSPPDLVQTADRRLCWCVSSLVFFFFICWLSTCDVRTRIDTYAHIHAHIHAHAHMHTRFLYSAQNIICRVCLGTLWNLWGYFREPEQKKSNNSNIIHKKRGMLTNMSFLSLLFTLIEHR